MSTPSRPTSVPTAEKKLDPVAILRRDNTLLDMLATGFRRLAGSLDTKGSIDLKRLEEGIAIHRVFLVELHHEMMEMFDRSLEGLPGAPLKSARTECHRAHTGAEAAAHKFEQELAALRKGDHAAAGRLKEALLREADRWTAHARSEEENLFSRLPESFRERTQEEIGGDLRKFRAASASIEERLSSWTSGWGAASD